MEEIIVSLDPAFHRVERFILWKNRYASLGAFAILHGIFYAMARAGLRPFCAVVLVVITLHVLDCLKRKKKASEEEGKLCELTRLVLRSYRYVCNTHESLNTLKTENKAKYSLVLAFLCLVLAWLGVKVNGFYLSYVMMLIVFTLPAVMYHKLAQKLLVRLEPIIQQLDESMHVQRRSLLDRNTLLVDVNKRSILQDEEDDIQLAKLREQQKKSNVLRPSPPAKQITTPPSTTTKKQQQQQKRRSLTTSDDEDEHEKLMNHPAFSFDANEDSQTMLQFRERYTNEPSSSSLLDTPSTVPKKQQQHSDTSSFDMLSDSASSVDEGETSYISELLNSGGGGDGTHNQFNGRQRIKIKGDELKIKGAGRGSKQRPKVFDPSFFQADNSSSATALRAAEDEGHSSRLFSPPSPPPSTSMSLLTNTSIAGTGSVGTEPDLSSFDFLNDYEPKT